MKALSTIGRYGVTAALSVPLLAVTLFVAMPEAQALSCSVIADQLSHQNDPLEDAAERLSNCAGKYAKYDETLVTKTKDEWQSLCDDDKSRYSEVLSNRQQILVNCRPRGSDG